jgi:hypothetical protein
MHELRRTFFEIIARGMSTVDRFSMNDPDGDLPHQLSSNPEAMAVIEDTIYALLDAAPEIEMRDGDDVRLRFVEDYPLTMRVVEGLHEVAQHVREALPGMKTDQMASAAKVISALETLPSRTHDVRFEMTFVGEDMGGGHGWASIAIDDTSIRLEAGETVRGDYGSDHSSGTISGRWPNGSTGDPGACLSHVNGALLKVMQTDNLKT